MPFHHFRIEHVPIGRRAHAGADLWADGDQTLGRQMADRLAHDGAGHTELFLKFGLCRQGGSGWDLPPGDLAAKIGSDGHGEAGTGFGTGRRKARSGSGHGHFHHSYDDCAIIA